ncbi:MAG: carbon-nitrogen family hydrolase [Mitsuokella sp.]
MRVSLLQMNVGLASEAENTATLLRLAEDAMRNKSEHPDVLVLPELWTTGFYPRPIKAHADPSGARARRVLAALSSRFGVNVVGGSVARLEGGKVYNTCYIADRSGAIIASYDKCHLFTPSGEDRDFTAGDRLVTFALDGVSCAVAICYDLRFPALFSALARAGAEVLFLPAAWPKVRLPHWRVLLRARAIENQIFVCACNAASKDRTLGGHSVLLDPWGESLGEAAGTEAIVTADLPLARRRSVKEKLDIFDDWREALYQKPPVSCTPLRRES